MAKPTKIRFTRNRKKSLLLTINLFALEKNSYFGVHYGLNKIKAQLEKMVNGKQFLAVDFEKCNVCLLGCFVKKGNEKGKRIKISILLLSKFLDEKKKKNLYF